MTEEDKKTITNKEGAPVAKEVVTKEATPTKDMPTDKTPQKEEGKSLSRKAQRRMNYARNRKAKGGAGRSDMEKRVLSVRRVARVVDGGRRFSMSVAVVMGDRNGKVGVGIGKGPDMTIAIEKATNNASKNLKRIKLTDEGSIAMDVSKKYCASVISLRPSKSFVAGGAVRTVLEFAGVKYVNAKILSRSKSAINNARATIKALETFNN